MCLVCSVGYMTAGAVVLASAPVVVTPSSVEPAEYSDFRATLKEVAAPTIEQPKWLKAQLAAEAAAAAEQAAQARRASSTITVGYSVSSRGVSAASIGEFRTLANQTLNDARGWARLNVRFVEVTTGGQFELILASAAEVGALPGCSAEYSCRYGGSVLINQDRWNGATDSWNAAGGNLRDYRHMVVNHEVGHWLGHGHTACSGAGRPAPVMLQQSIDLQGCSFNPWPLASELQSPQLGI